MAGYQPCTAKGVACESRLEPLPSLASLAVGSTPTAKIMCLLALLDVRNAISLCLHVCLVYEQQNNNFIFTCTNELEYENQHLFAGKGGCTNYQGIQIIRNYTVHFRVQGEAGQLVVTYYIFFHLQDYLKLQCNYSSRLPMKTCLLNLALGIMLIGFFFSVVYHTLCVPRYTLEMSYCSQYSQLFSNLAT